ncbi:pyruvoyl-dependent arginine decarboxylase [Nocardia goodfellowii]|uniref:Pyruvoyl-dependent arginine decarboxylase AaxB n=1 Tax=Nocardia goodfellowii TaxID=882446 RepID=A0ABS4QN28_9NOCA|nr:pyruvoyl-dependent arginine decarboxylase [Nocardia goodfellowii]MBP2193113.1 arginine decarboxylase [Nocardia goodfellowii]
MATELALGRSLVPSHMFFTSAVGMHERELQAHDLMYMAAGLGRVNRVQVSSRVPPGCQLLSRTAGLELIHEGQILFAIQALAETDQPGQRIATAVGIATPVQGGIGCVAEVHEQDSIGKTEDQARRKSVEMALTAMAAELGVEGYDGAAEYRDGQDRYSIEGTEVRTDCIGAAAVGDINGRVSKIVATLVFLL